MKPCAVQSQTRRAVHVSPMNAVAAPIRIAVHAASHAAAAKTASQSASPITPRSASDWSHTFCTPYW